MVAQCPVALDSDRPAPHRTVDADQAEDFVRTVHDELPELGPATARVTDVRREIARSGTYRHTPAELRHGARLAWRNASRCIGRLYWRSLVVRDRRDVTDAGGMAAECVEHLRVATNGGRIRPVVTLFAPAGPDGTGPRILGDQLIRYAGYRSERGEVLGDPSQVTATERALALGWRGGAGTPFDVLPLVVQPAGEGPRLFDLPADAVLEVPISHPDLPWLARLGLWWHAVPAIARMPLEIGGLVYTAAPFNGWYLGTEIGARNLADTDRYDLLPEIARRMGLDTSSDRNHVEGPGAGRAQRGRAALVRPGRGDPRRPPHRVRALPHPPGAGGGGRPDLPGRLVLDRAAGLRRGHPGVPPLLRRRRPHPPLPLRLRGVDHVKHAGGHLATHAGVLR